MLSFPPFINQILKKNRELKMAAELGRKMLEENDGLRGMYNELEHEHEKTVKVRNLYIKFKLFKIELALFN